MESARELSSQLALEAGGGGGAVVGANVGGVVGVDNEVDAGRGAGDDEAHEEREAVLRVLLELGAVVHSEARAGFGPRAHLPEPKGRWSQKQKVESKGARHAETAGSDDRIKRGSSAPKGGGRGAHRRGVVRSVVPWSTPCAVARVCGTRAGHG